MKIPVYEKFVGNEIPICRSTKLREFRPSTHCSPSRFEKRTFNAGGERLEQSASFFSSPLHCLVRRGRVSRASLPPTR
jgi:hypothetical protein